MFHNATLFVLDETTATAQAQANIVRLVDAIDAYGNDLQVLLRSTDGITFAQFIEGASAHVLLHSQVPMIQAKYDELVAQCPADKRAKVEKRLGKYACAFYQLFSKAL